MAWVREGLEGHVKWLGVYLLSNGGCHGAICGAMWSDLWFVNMAMVAYREVGENLVAGQSISLPDYKFLVGSDRPCLFL